MKNSKPRMIILMTILLYYMKGSDDHCMYEIIKNI